MLGFNCFSEGLEQIDSDASRLSGLAGLRGGGRGMECGQPLNAEDVQRAWLAQGRACG